MKTAVAYLRRSRVDTARPGTISYEQQLAAVRKLAAEHGDDPDTLLVLEDWGRSGRAEKQAAREAYARLEAMLTEGSVSAIYSYTISRLARSMEILGRLAKLCQDAGVPIRCADGYSPDVSTATGRMVLSILGAVAQWQAEWTQERATEALAIRRVRGDHMGPAPYGYRMRGGKLHADPREDVDVLVAAFLEAGTYQGAARLLTTRGVPTRTGRRWAASSLKPMLERYAPKMLPDHPKRGRRPIRDFVLGGLLRCGRPGCGATLTGRHLRSGNVAYECRRAAGIPDHGHPRSVAEAAVLPFVRSEAARLRVPAAVKMGMDADAGAREALEERRRRVIDNFESILIDRAERDAKMLAIADELERLEATAQIVALPPAVDFDWPPAELGAVLRAVFEYVELDDQMQPVRAEWRVREWRAEGAER